MADGTVRVNFAADVSDVRKGTQQVVKEIDKVNKAAEKSSAGAARSSSKALTGILRLIQTGDVSSKKLDKIGKSASGLLGGLSSIGVGLGLGALPLASDIAVKAIKKIQDASKTLTTRIGEAASAQRDLTLAQLAASGSLDGLTQAQEAAKKAHADLDKARSSSRAGVKELTTLEDAHTKAVRDQARAQKVARDAAAALAKARKPKADGGEGKSGSQLTQLERDQTNARLAATKATKDARAAEDALTDAKKRRKVPAAEIAKLEREAAKADRDAAAAGITLAESQAAAAAAADKYGSALQTVVDKAMKPFTREIREFDKDGHVFVRTVVDQAKASEAAAAALRKHAGTAKGLTADQRQLETSVAKYIETTKTVPKDLKTVIALIGQGKSIKDIQKYLGETNKVPKKKSTSITTPGIEKSIRDTLTLRGVINSLHSKSINVTVNRNEREGTGKTPAVGARIAGRFDGKDNIPTWVSKGEVILNPQQQSLIDGGMSINSALSSTGALTIRAGGGYAGGGKATVAERHQALLDNAKSRFGGFMSSDDLALAKAERTPSFSDDRKVLTAQRQHIIARIQQIRRTRTKYKKWLSRSQKQDLNDEEASLTRQLTDIGGQLAPAPADPGDTAGDTGGAAAATDPFELDRARIAGVTEGLGRANAYVFGGSGDIGYGQGGSAIQSAGSVHFENVSFTNSVQNTAAFAQASNVGNDVISGGRIRSSRQGVAF